MGPFPSAHRGAIITPVAIQHISRERLAFVLRVGFGLALGIPVPIWVYGAFPREPFLIYGSCIYLSISAILGYGEKRKRRLGLFGVLVVAPLLVRVSLDTIRGYARTRDSSFLAWGFVMFIFSATFAAASVITAVLGYYVRQLQARP